MKKIKIVTVVGTRPEIIRLSSIINRLNSSNHIDHRLDQKHFLLVLFYFVDIVA